MPEFEYHGTEEFRRLIQALPTLALEAAEPAMEDSLVYLHGLIPEYPPALENSRYKRTGTLGRRITTAVEAEDLAVVGLIGSNLAHAPWVVGPDYPGEEIGGQTKFQARVHVDRWWQVGQVVEENIDSFWTEFEQKFWPDFRARIDQAMDELRAELGGDNA